MTSTKVSNSDSEFIRWNLLGLKSHLLLLLILVSKLILIVSALPWANRCIRLIAVFEVNQNIVALDVIMGDIVRLDYLECLEHLFVDRKIEAQVLHDVSLLAKAPLSKRARVLLHDYVVACLIDTVIEKICHAWLKSEFLQTSDLCEDIVQDAPIRDWLG